MNSFPGGWCITGHKEPDIDKAQRLSSELNVPFRELSSLSNSDYFIVDDDRLGVYLAEPGIKIFIEFDQSRMAYRSARVEHELLIKAMGKNIPAKAHIYDLTAGMGRDAFLFAAAGYRVTMCEQNPVLVALLRDALERAQSSVPEIQSRISLFAGNAIEFLQQNTVSMEDFLYLDPMFQDDGVNARVKKETQALHYLVGDSCDGEELFAAAGSANFRKMIVKRALRARTMGNKKPNYQVKGKAIRFDVYLKSQFDVESGG